MRRIFTMRKSCLACSRYFTITSAASKFCKLDECIKRRRKQYRKERKEALLNAVRIGSREHLARALRDGD